MVALPTDASVRATVKRAPDQYDWGTVNGGDGRSKPTAGPNHARASAEVVL